MAALLVVAGVACSSKGPGEGQERGRCFANGTCHDGLSCRSEVCIKLDDDQEQGAVDRPKVATGSKSQPATTPSDVDAVKAFLAAWLAAQNAGSFDQYIGFYAAEFTGVRRTGPKKRSFDLDGWRQDRSKMFKAKMTVTADDVVVDVQETYALIRFTQKFAVKGFKDKGPKQLVLIRDGDAWQISREDMLASDYRSPNACDPAKEYCTGDDEFYANEDWDAYSDDKGGQTHLVDELAFRYQPDIRRCFEASGQPARAGRLRGQVVQGGVLKGAQVVDLDDRTAKCIERVALKTWIFADPDEAAWNDASPATIKQGFVRFEVALPTK